MAFCPSALCGYSTHKPFHKHPLCRASCASHHAQVLMTVPVEQKSSKVQPGQGRDLHMTAVCSLQHHLTPAPARTRSTAAPDSQCSHPGGVARHGGHTPAPGHVPHTHGLRDHPACMGHVDAHKVSLSSADMLWCKAGQRQSLETMRRPRSSSQMLDL